MNTYPKILIATLPLVFLLLLGTVGIAHHFSRKALTELAETWLDTRLTEALQVVASHDAMLHRYGLESIPASIAKAKMDAAVTMAAIEVGEQGYVFAVDRRGAVVMHPDPAMVGRSVAEEPWFRDLRPGRSRLVHSMPTGRHLAMVDFFEPWEWFVLATDPEQEFYGVADRMTPYLVGLGIGGFVVMAAALMVLTGRLTEPLRQLTDGAERIGHGDLDTAISIRSADEFGRLAAVFNRMARQLQETLTALRDEEEHFRSLIENASDLIAVLDVDGCITYLSPSVERILGYSPVDVIGRRAFDFIHPDDLDHALTLFDKRMHKDGTESPAQLRFRHKEGSWRFIEAVSNNMLHHPAVNGLVVNARDITQRKDAEAALQQSHQELEDRVAERTAELFKTNARLRQEIQEREAVRREKEKLQAQLLQAQKMEAIGTLAGGIAHDFNNLLMGIQGNAEMMAIDREVTQSQIERVKIIQECVHSGARLTQQLLGFARMGKYEVKTTDINALVRNSVDMFGRTRQELEIVQRYEQNLWPVEVDRGQIEQVLLNLFINAWQAMPEGGTLTLATANVTLGDPQVLPHGAEVGDYVVITITDTGVGMEPAILERIFDPFFTTKTMGRGTGLGLASAYGIVRNHGGFIDVHSRKGEGSTFDIHLKASPSPTADVVRPSASMVAGDETVLLVDDDALILDVGEAMLKALGYRVLVARSGSEAVDIYRRVGDQIRLVILDMIMPDIGGGKTYDQLKAIDPGVTVLLSSGYSIDGQASAIMKRGCNGFIQKPFDLHSLSVKVRAIIDGAG